MCHTTLFHMLPLFWTKKVNQTKFKKASAKKEPALVFLEKRGAFSQVTVYFYPWTLGRGCVLSVKSSLTSASWLTNKIVVVWVWIWFSISILHYCCRSCFHWYSCLNCLLLEFSNPSQILILQPFSTCVRHTTFQFPSNNALECMVLQSLSEGHKTTLVLWR